MTDLLLVAQLVTDTISAITTDASGILSAALVQAADAQAVAADAMATQVDAPSAVRKAIDFVLRIDKYLDGFIQGYGAWVYVLLFVIVFCETGLVVTPFLPGDSLLFTAGALCGDGRLNFWLVAVLLLIAAILGDTVNYYIGSRFRDIFRAGGTVPLVKPAHLERTQRFFDKYGGKAIVLARFVPIVRTVAPFFAGVGSMNYRKFIYFNVLGALLWVGICTGAGYVFGNIPAVKKNFGLVVIGIIIISMIPIAIEALIAYRESRRSAPAAGKN